MRAVIYRCAQRVAGVPAGRSERSPTGLKYCQRVFAIERELRQASPEERFQTRLQRSRPILEKFASWLRQQQSLVLPKSLVGTAVTYYLNQWTKLEAFLLDGRLDVDNNRSERVIKSFVIGRNNWLFANTPRGARANAIIYSIVETAKENNLNPFAYLQYLFEQLPNRDLTDPAALDAVLPWSPTLPPSPQCPLATENALAPDADSEAKSHYGPTRVP